MNQNNLPDLTIVKGVIAMALGLMCIVFAYGIIMRMMFFVAGTGLVYYGLRLLNIPALNNVLTLIKAYWNRLFS